MRWAVFVGMLTIGVGCSGTPSSKSGVGPEPTDPRLALAQLELARSFARDEVIGLARAGEAERRVAAIRALARLGDEESVAVLRELLLDTNSVVRVAVARALGITGAKNAELDLLAAHRRFSDSSTRASILWALGRVGSSVAHQVLVTSLGASETERVEAGIALGMHGRRNIASSASARTGLIANTRNAAAPVRYAATYALAREHPAVPASTDAEFALAERARSDSDESVRSLAVFGMVRRTLRLPMERLLEDQSWRVRVQLMRVLPEARVEQRDDLLFALSALMLRLGKQPGPVDLHPIKAGLRSMLRLPNLREIEKKSASSFYARAGALLRQLGSTASELHCLAAALAVRAGDAWTDIKRCGGPAGSGFPMHGRRALEARLLAEGYGGDAPQRMGRLLAMAKDGDARVRGVTLTALIVLAKDPTATPALLGLALAGIDDPDIEVAGAATELSAALVEHKVPLVGTQLAKKLVTRARNVTEEPELRLGLLGIIGKAKLTSGTIACRLALGDPNVSVRKAGQTCLALLTGADAGAGKPRARLSRPPADPGALIGKQIVWSVRTSRGTIRIRLDSARAPWHVATVVSLSRRGFYDTLPWHRVVPDFVIQGGDPRGSGWGGPGYTIPGEPWGAFRRGTVGIADAGMDTGGSQWFVMHSRAPHLDGRYTIIGQVESGLDVVDAIQAGDRILSTTVEVR